MNKTVLFAVIGVLLLAGGTTAFFVLRPDEPDPIAALPPVPGGTPAPGPVRRVTAASLGDLLALGMEAPQLCTTVSGSTTRSARVAVGDGSLRADVAVPKKYTGGTSHLILNDTSAYAWSDNAKYGFKMSRGTGTDSSTAASLGANEPADYDCVPATLGGETFRPPQDVVFADLRNVYGDVCLTWVPVCPLYEMPTCSNGGWVCGDIGGVTAGFSFSGTPTGGGGTTSGGGGGGSSPEDEQAAKEAYCAAACANAPEPQCRASLGCD